METKDQKFYKVDGKQKAEIDVYITHERVEGEKAPPSIKDCRHAVLPLANGGYVTYDRLLNRIVNGVYYNSVEGALESAELYNEYDGSPQDMAPNGLALGLIYPRQKR